MSCSQVNRVTLVASDPTAVETFHREVLGLGKNPPGAVEWQVLSCPRLPNGTAVYRRSVPDRRSVDASAARAEQFGGCVVEPAAETDGIYTAVVRDPAGHLWEIAENAPAAYGVRIAEDAVRFRRVLPASIERVWEFLIDGEKRGRWLAGGDTELRIGGKIVLNFRHADLSPVKEPFPEKYVAIQDGFYSDGVITLVESPRRFRFLWNETEGDPSEVAIELIPDGQKTELVLTHTRLASLAVIRDVCGGWHTHLAILEDVLDNREPRPFWSSHLALEAEYAQRIG